MVSLREVSLTARQYMIVLFLLFLVQFAVACACLAVNQQQQHRLAQQVRAQPDVVVVVFRILHYILQGEFKMVKSQATVLQHYAAPINQFIRWKSKLHGWGGWGVR